MDAFGRLARRISQRHVQQPVYDSAADQLTVDPTNAQIIYVAKGYGGNPHIMRYDPAGAGNWVQIEGAAAPAAIRRRTSITAISSLSGTNILVNANDGGIYFIRNPQNAAANRWTSLHGRGATAISATEYTQRRVGQHIQRGDRRRPGQRHRRGERHGRPHLDALQLCRRRRRASGYRQRRRRARLSLRQRAELQLLRRFDGAGAIHIRHSNQPTVAAVELMPAGGLANFNGPFTPLYELNNVNPARLVTGDTTGTPGTSPVYELLNAATAPNAAGAHVASGAGGAGFGGVSGSAIAYGGRLGGVDNPEVLVVGATARRVRPLHCRRHADRHADGVPRRHDSGCRARPAELAALLRRGWLERLRDARRRHDLEQHHAQSGVGQFRACSRWSSFPRRTAGPCVVGGNLGVSKLLLDSPTAQWTRFGVGLPNAVVFDLDYDPVDDLLLGGTFGRGAWQVANAATVVDDAGVLNICGDEDFVNQDDVFRLIRNAMNPLVLDVFVNSIAPVFSVAIAALSQINVFGIGGNDTLIVDSTQRPDQRPERHPLRRRRRVPGRAARLWLRPRHRHAATAANRRRHPHQRYRSALAPRWVRAVSTIVGAGVGNVQTIFFEELEPVLDDVPAATFFVNGRPGRRLVCCKPPTPSTMKSVRRWRHGRPDYGRCV